MKKHALIAAALTLALVACVKVEQPDHAQASSSHSSPASPAPVAPAVTSSSAPASSAALVHGAINPGVTQATIKQTICVSGWTATIRPPASYTTKLKLSQMAQFKLVGTASNFEEDHLISLELGGNPTSPLNLWPQSWTGAHNAHQKDALENRLKSLVCAGTITLAQAQHEISTDWIASYRVRIGAI